MGEKLGICFTGGGARGAYQAGVAVALEELGILARARAFAGTSIGAANAAVLATRGGAALRDVWFSLPEDNLPRNPVDREETPWYRRFRLDRGVYSMEVYERVLREAVDYDRLKAREVYATLSRGGRRDEGLLDLIRATYRHYVLKESNALYVPLHDLDREAALRALIASASIPVLFPPVTLDEHKYYDGGVFDNVPIPPLIDAGCDEILIVHLHRHPFYDPKKLATEGVVFHEIKHEGSLGRVLDFDAEHLADLYECGYDDATYYFYRLNSPRPAARDLEGSGSEER